MEPEQDALLGALEEGLEALLDAAAQLAEANRWVSLRECVALFAPAYTPVEVRGALARLGKRRPVAIRARAWLAGTLKADVYVAWQNSNDRD